jgi:hypothetical protein
VFFCGHLYMLIDAAGLILIFIYFDTLTVSFSVKLL